jgi:Na+:H+ antiporter, NhaA family
LAFYENHAISAAMIAKIRDFFKLESSSSVILLVMLLLAMICANSPLALHYDMLHGPVANLVINDGLMALFFLVIGIEIKMELVEGELSSLHQALLPVFAALGGVAMPALIFMAFNAGTPNASGWAIPVATDIAFSLAVLGFFGSRVPVSLKIFLMALAIIDDLIAVIVIAIFYTASISYEALGMAIGCTLLLALYNRKVIRLMPYLLAGAALWITMHESGIHATIAGVLLGLLLPVPLGKRVLHGLHPSVAYIIVPLFVFANAGIPLGNIPPDALLQPLVLGIAAGLFVGKQVGIFSTVWLLVRLGFARLPTSVTWLQLYSVCLIAGIGFTMSLFIGTLAFHAGPLMDETRLGVILGSLASAVMGAIVMAYACPVKNTVPVSDQPK